MTYFLALVVVFCWTIHTFPHLFFVALVLEDLEYGFLSYIIYNNQFVIYVIVAIGHYDEISNFLLFQTT
jgi:hypothetical protein